MPGIADHAGTVAIAAGAILLLWAGVPKLAPGPRRAVGFRSARGSRRALGLAEVLAALAIMLGPGRLAAGLLAAIFLVFTAKHVRDAVVGIRGCQCFGADDDVQAVRGALLALLVACLAAGAAALGAPSLRELASGDGAALAWTPAAALAAALAWRIAFSGTGWLTRLVDVSGALIAGAAAPRRPDGRTGGEFRLSGGDLGLAESEVGLDGALGQIERRRFLLRVAVVGSALATAPVRYILYPGTALGAVVRPWECHSGLCTDGYTGFCCEINQGGANACPTGTFAGGWWMCTDYAGRRLCSEQHVRYYIDCNALPGMPFPGGCRCGNDSCASRRIACNVFRYGQCNTHIAGTTAVVCRMVVCENPSKISGMHCSAAMAIDNAVCGHDVACLEPPALELAGAGGA